MTNYDVIIIGSGLGGLTAGAKLAKAGKKILMLEQHSIPGGCATTFNRKGFKVEVGLNITGGLDKDDIKTKIFEELGILHHVNYLRMSDFYRCSFGDRSFVVPDHVEKAIEALTGWFPGESKNIHRYFNRILRIRKEINRYCALPPRLHKAILPIMPFIYPAIVLNMFKTVGQLLDSCFKNEQLKSILVANMPFLHDDPCSMSLLYYSAAQAEYFNGSYFIRGGSQELSNYLAGVITSNGGEILYSRLATRIITKGNKAIGVEYSAKNDPENKVITYANTVVANASVPQVASELLQGEPGLRLAKRIKKLENSCSFFMVFLRFNRPVRELGNTNYIHFINSAEDFTADQWKSANGKDFEERPFYFCDYSQFDAQLTPAGKGQGVICCTDYLSNWENLSQDAYKEKKQVAAEKLIDRLNHIIPGIKDEIEGFEVSTPKTIKRYILTPGGAVYGFAQTVKQAVPNRLSVKSPIPNLYFASSWAFPGGGFTGAIISGYTCARAILD